MRLRTVAASAALVLCATTGAAACSSSPDAADTSRPAGPAATKPAPAEDVRGRIETGKRQAGAPKTGGHDGAHSPECAASAAEIPEKCALDISFAESTDGEPGDGAPVMQ
ncbi:hypothetical protein [Streptomyces flavofungini]|uniref:Uncharacterized protein n=1 Tax=Streptomyces flavofungini TaxID=68200 RepID=A0ABS0X3G3_9ACTN|nr:hypothetical protein [Streptomyces flavofungini]MBJ3807586.1 hypothetical protein [Streptomyces flavofungini]GHC64649.1 hypothetical protein GCM10010349_35910 [Streptomyces flavofungini]